MTTSYRKIKLFVLLVLPLNVSIWAQSPKISYTLDNDESGTSRSYVAQKNITLQPPFRYDATIGKSFSARIDPGLLFPPTTNLFLLPNGLITEDSIQGGVVGSIQGSASVTPIGAATYVIPIEIPEGIAGMKPQVAIAYNSQGGFGALGTGWDISGISSISRTTQNLYFDDVDGAIASASISFNTNDRLSLDGQRLILLNGTHFSVNAEYGTEIENYSRTKILTNSATGYIYFVVTSVDGKVMEYGKSSNSLVLNNSNTSDGKILAWKLNKVTDVYGNYIEYTYSDNGQYLSKIDYTGTSTNNSPSKSMVFNYNTNTANPKTFYIGTFQLKQQKILSSIVTYSDQVEIRRYSFQFTTNSRLSSVTELAQGNEKLRSTTIGWGNSSSIQEVYVAPVTDSKISTSQDKGFIETGDVNGDGYLDRIECWLGTNSNHDGYFNVYLYDKNTHTFRTTPLNRPVTYYDEAYKPKITVNDIDNDGNSEIVLANAGWLFQFDYSPGYMGLGEGLILNKAFNTRTKYNINRTFEIFSANVNNDRYNDVIIAFNNCNYPTHYGVLTFWQELEIALGLDLEPGYQVYYGGEYGLTRDTLTDSHFFNDETYSQFSLGDFNADGKMDILGLAKSNTGCHTIYNNELTMVSSQQWGQASYQNPFTKRVTADVNNDGLTDIIENYPDANITGVTVNNSLHIITNTGGFSSILNNNPITLAPTGASVFPNNEMTSFFPIDYNGDGQVDLIIGDNEVEFNITDGYVLTGQSYWYFYKNVNGSFIYDTRVHWDQAIAKGNAAHYMDVNFDGCMDLVVPKGESFVAFTMPNALKNNLVSSITNGFGTTQSFTYTNYSEYGSFDYDPIRGLKSPMVVVGTYTDMDGSVTEYSFQDGVIHTDGKGFLGFSTVTEKNQVKNSKLVTNYDYDFNFFKMDVTSQIISNYVGNPISTISQTTDIKVVDAVKKRIIPVVESKTSTDNLKGLTSTTQTLLYDSYFNVTKQKTTVGTQSTTVETCYDARISNGPHYLPVSVKITKENGIDSEIRTTHYAYNSNGILTREVKDSLDVNKLVTAYSSFDPWGHPSNIKVQANGMTHNSSIEYSDNGYYIKKKTNHLGEVTNYIWDDIYGNLSSETDHWGHTTTYKYNKWGQLEETILPDGNRAVSVLRWATPSNSLGAKYYNYSETSGSKPLWKWYDIQGRLICEQSYGLNGNLVNLLTDYYSNGKIHIKYKPTFNTSYKSEEAHYHYDAYGRVDKISTPRGDINYFYNGIIDSICSYDGTKKTILNTAGQIVSNRVNGKGVNYIYFASGLVKLTTPDGGQPLTMAYNLQGKRTSLDDPDGGVVESSYNGFGNLISEIQSSKNVTTTNNYNQQTGLLESTLKHGTNDETTVYTYDTSNGHIGRIKSVEIAGKHKRTYTYDGFGRMTNQKEEFNGRTYNQGTEFDVLGRVKKTIYPSGYFTLNNYDDYGHLTEINDNNGRVIWKALAENEKGLLTQISKGGLTTNYEYDDNGLPRSMEVADKLYYEYSFDSGGNLLYRFKFTNEASLNNADFFTYDDQKRLQSWDLYWDYGSTWVKSDTITYDAKGNISRKTDLSNTMTMSYGENGKPHALTSIDGKPDAIAADSLTVTYTDFNKIATLKEGNKYYELSYGIDEERLKSTYKVNNSTQLTRYYLGDYEEEIDSNGNIRKIHYLSGGAVLIQNHGIDSLLYGYTDYQGSLVMLTDESGNVLEEYAYDPWGARRDPNDWSQKDSRTHWLLNRGYTGHEHLDAFAIINMNGRVYDPLTAAFFSPDPFIQTPDDWLNYNRYSYVLNNPMKYTDPTGNLFYLGIGYSWSWYGGSSLSISFGYGFSGGLSIGFTGGYGFKDGNYFATVNASAAGYYGYGGYDTKGGFICGAGFGIGGNKYSGNVGFMIYTNLLDISVNYSSNGGWTANVFGMQYSRNGVIFDPSLGGGFTYSFQAKREQTILIPNEDPYAILRETMLEHQNQDLPNVEIEMPEAEGLEAGNLGVIDRLVYNAKYISKYRTEGTLTAYASDGTVMSEFKASSGSGSGQIAYTIPQGTVYAYGYEKTSDRRFSNHSIGFKVLLTNIYDPNLGRLRELLRIHPAKLGTLGCIGLIGDARNLLRFQQMWLSTYTFNVKVRVDIKY